MYVVYRNISVTAVVSELLEWIVNSKYTLFIVYMYNHSIQKKRENNCSAPSTYAHKLHVCLILKQALRAAEVFYIS